MHSTPRTAQGVIISVLVMFLAATLSYTVASHKSGAVGDSRDDSHSVILGSADDRLPNLTVDDWVTYADYVVVATASKQDEIAPTGLELKRGEGLILRDVSLNVDEVLWASPNAAKKMPGSFHQTALGWKFSGDDLTNRQEMAARGSPRIEVGHTYVMAVEWEPARCAPGDQVPSGWYGLGAASVLPYDGGKVGQGEMEGTERSVSAARIAAKEDPDRSVSSIAIGQPAEYIRALLTDASPEARKEFGPQGDFSCK